MKPILHIGLGKTSTTFLQTVFLPEILKYSDRIYFKEDAQLTNKILDHKDRMIQGKKINKIKLPRNIFISNESLSAPGGWDPVYFEKFADLNLVAFGSNCEILITIRKPYDWLRSNYTRNIGKLNVISEENFYLSNHDYKNYEIDDLHCKFFSLEEFSYEKLYKIYTERFSKVTLIKYENLKKFDTWKNIINLEIDEYKQILEIKNKIINHGLSKKSIKMTFVFNKYLSYLNLSLEKIHYSKKKLILKNKSNFFAKYFNKLLGFFDWKKLLKFMDRRVFKYEKYELQTNHFIDSQIKRLQDEYDKIT